MIFFRPYLKMIVAAINNPTISSIIEAIRDMLFNLFEKKD